MEGLKPKILPFKIYSSILGPMLSWIRKISRNITVASILVVVAVFVFLGTSQVNAQVNTGDTFGLKGIDQTVQLANQDIRVIASKIIRAVLGLLGIIALSLVLYAGYTIMTSAGNEEKVTQGKKILTNAVIGLIIIMSAFTIVQFVLNALTSATGTGAGDEGGGTKPKFVTFSGSGGLGSIIKDHYPMRNQTGVPRNTKIAITFFDPIDPASIIIDTNKSCWGIDGKPTSTLILDKCQKYTEAIPAKKINVGDAKIYYGDCLDVNNDDKIDSISECDHLVTSSIKIYKSENKDIKDLPVFEATAMAAYEINDGVAKTNTFVFKPEEFLGSGETDVLHTVYLVGGDNLKLGVKKADGTDLFYGQFSAHYEWEFETNTVVDFSAPHVVATYPKEDGIIPRNTVIQIYYNEPIDPIISQGTMSTSSAPGYENAIFSTTTVSGRWNITNGYTTMEFVPNIPCGTNSCGGIMYCLPVNCAPTDANCLTQMTTLVRTAELLDNSNTKSFLAQPLGYGIMDMAGNAMDNGPGNVPDDIVANPHKPEVGPGGNKLIGGKEEAVDNYWWSFVIQNKIDREAPYVEKVKPGIDTEGVKGLKPVIIDFSKILLLSNLPESVKLEEYPANVKPPGSAEGLDSMPIAYRSTMSDGLIPKTSLNLVPGRDFGPNNLDLYYLTSVSSSVMSVNMNCLYPGRGPASVKKNPVDSPLCSVKSTVTGDYFSSENCIIQKDWDSTKDTGCSITNGDANFKTATDKVNVCITQIKTVSPNQNIPQ